MSILVGVDPGKNLCAWSVFRDAVLYGCGLANPHSMSPWTLWHADVCIVEVPQVYQQRLLKGDPNDLVDVAVAAGMMGKAVNALRTEFVRPHAWKGSTPKAVMNKRVAALLSPAELRILQKTEIPRGLKHNVLDAIGIALWKLGRLRKR